MIHSILIREDIETSYGSTYYASYYFITVDNFCSDGVVIGQKVPTGTDVVNGMKSDSPGNISYKNRQSLFKQGEAGGFMHTLVAEIGIDSKKSSNFYESQDNILKAITNQRLSVSGVDIDEEAMSLIRFQNAYNLSSKVISIMDEIYDRLINYMGV